MSQNTNNRFVTTVLICLFGGTCVRGEYPRLQVQTGHSGKVNAIAFSPDGKLMASGGDDRTVIIWDAERGVELRTFVTDNEVDSVAFSPDGKTMAAGGELQPTTLWDIDSGKILFHLSKLSNAIAFNPDGNSIAVAGVGEISFFSTSTGKEIKTIFAPGQLHSIVFGPDGKLLAGGGYLSGVVVWDVDSGNFRPTMGDPAVRIWSVAFSPDGKTIASGGDDKSITFWHTATGKLIRSIRTEAMARISDIEFSRDGLTVLSNGTLDGVNLWDVATGKNKVKSLDLGNCARFGPDGKSVAIGSTGGSIRLISLSEKKTVMSYTSRTEAAATAEISSNGRYIANSAFACEATNIWDTGNGAIVQTQKDQCFASFNAQGNLFATQDMTSFHIWASGTGIEIQRMTKSAFGATYDVSTMGWLLDPVAFSPDGKTLLSRNPKLLNFWNTETGTRRFGTSNDAKVVSDVVYSSDGKLIAVGTTDGVGIFEAESGKLIGTAAGKCKNARSLAFGPDGKTLATGCYDAGNKPVIIIWDTASLSEIGTLAEPQPKPASDAGELKDALKSLVSSFLGQLPGRKEISVTFSHDGNLLATVGKNPDVIRVWDAHTMQLLREFSGHSSYVNSIDFSPDDKIILSGSGDGTMILWDVATGGKLATMFSLAATDGKGKKKASDNLIVTPDGLFDGSPSAWRQIQWRFSEKTFDIDPVEIYFNDYFYPGLLSDLMKGVRPHASKNLADLDRRQPIFSISLSDGSHQGPIESRTVALQVSIQSAPAGARDVRLFRNGLLTKSWIGDVRLDANGRATLTTEVPLTAGENRFIAYGFNRDNIKSADADLSITGPTSLERRGTAYILAIGINGYQDINKLNFAVSDANDFGQLLQRQLQKLGQYEDARLIQLDDAEATRKNILSALKYFGRDKANESDEGLPPQLGQIIPARPEDTIVIYFAGHGMARGQRFYLLPQDVSTSNIEQTSISDLDLYSGLEPVIAGHILMVIDACQSGQALGKETEGRAPMNSKGLAQLAYDKGLVVLTAAQSQQAALEAVSIGGKQINHGLLTYTLLDAFNVPEADKDGNNLLWDREWFDYAAAQVPLLQLEAMKERHDDIKKTGRGVEIIYVKGDKNSDPNKRLVQTPRVFYRGDADLSPLVISAY